MKTWIIIFFALILLIGIFVSIFGRSGSSNIGKHAYNKTNGIYRGKITNEKPCNTAPTITCYVIENPEFSRPIEAPVDNVEVKEQKTDR